ncbi:MAG TPA: sensor histidine kinase [Pseudonocardiaceae bacterium]|nr:sensor histidine kinase [Pseudonocardiaceae bacterium]
MSPYRRRLVDIGLTIAVAVATAVMIAVADRTNARPPDLFGYLLAPAIAAPVLARRHHPVAVLLATFVLLHVYFALNYPSIEPAVPLAVPLYAAAVSGRPRWSWLTAAWTMITTMIMFRMHEHVPFPQLAGKLVDDGALLAVVLLFAHGVSTRRAKLAQEAGRLVAEQRLRIARDVHDIVAHTVSVITIQAGLADERLGDDGHPAKPAIGAIRSSAREAMSQLRAAVGLLPAPGLAELDQLFRLARAGGLLVHADIAPRATELPAHVQLAGYRIVQEAVTNTVRHANASSVAVTIRCDEESTTIEVLDDGTGTAWPGRDRLGNPSSGHGLIGMTERALTVNGSLTAGPAPDGGFLVHARLPSSAVVGSALI